MKKESLSKYIEEYLKKRNCFVNGGEIERLAEAVGFKASNASRRCREMESGLLSNGKTRPVVLERKVMNGSVWYRHLQGAVLTEKVVVKSKPKVELREINGMRVAVMH